MELQNILLVVILCFLILYTITHLTPLPQPEPHPIPYEEVGGCRGTRYGCCPYNMTPKRDMNGSNCYWKII